jgi:hypothetical protein
MPCTNALIFAIDGQSKTPRAAARRTMNSGLMLHEDKGQPGTLQAKAVQQGGA